MDATYFPMTSIPSCSALAREVRMQIPAPSPIPLAFPAVVLAFPHCGNAGFKAARSSRLTPGRIVSSTDTINPFISIGRISSVKIPLARACMVITTKVHFQDIMSHLCGPAVRNEGIFILLSTRDLIMLSNHF